MNIKKIVYGGTLIALLSSGIFSNTAKYAGAEVMPPSTIKAEPARALHYTTSKKTLTTSELESIIGKQYSLLRELDNEYKLTPEKEAVINMDYSLRKVFIESTNNITAKSDAGAAGLWQVTRDAWNQVEKKYDYDTYKYDPQISTRVGIKYLMHVYDFLEKNHPEWSIMDTKTKRELLSAAYNGGPNRLIDRDFDINIMPRETKRYVEKMKAPHPIVKTKMPRTSSELVYR